MKLTEDERTMIDLFRAINGHQKSKAIALAERLSEQKRGEVFRMETKTTSGLKR